jgi:hypothetical protein
MEKQKKCFVICPVGEDNSPIRKCPCFGLRGQKGALLIIAII